MAKENLRMITTIGLVYYNFEYKANSVDQLAASIDAKMKAYTTTLQRNTHRYIR